MFAAEEFDCSLVSVIFTTCVALECVESAVELLFDAVLVTMGLVCCVVLVVIEPLRANEAREASLLSGETKAKLLPCKVPCRKSCPSSGLVSPMMKMSPNLLAFP